MMKVYQRFIYVWFILMAICVFIVSDPTPSGAQDGENSKITFYVH